ncbi:MAG: hypothetical protein R3F37_06945 [Candidatus Competibacteraceae bacterium]
MAAIQYLDSDDLLLPDKFACQVAALEINKDCGVAYGKARYYPIGAMPPDPGQRDARGKHFESHVSKFYC